MSNCFHFHITTHKQGWTHWKRKRLLGLREKKLYGKPCGCCVTELDTAKRVQEDKPTHQPQQAQINEEYERMQFSVQQQRDMTDAVCVAAVSEFRSASYRISHAGSSSSKILADCPGTTTTKPHLSQSPYRLCNLPHGLNGNT